jgi:hypothetical protein
VADWKLAVAILADPHPVLPATLPQPAGLADVALPGVNVNKKDAVVTVKYFRSNELV